MAGLGILVTWFGYSVLYYGITQVQGGNWGYLDLIAPGRWTAAVAATPRDSSYNGSLTPGATGVTTTPGAPGSADTLTPTGPNGSPGDVLPPGYTGGTGGAYS